MRSSLIKSSILLIALLAFNIPGYTQNKFEISGGIGFPDLLNLRIKYGRNFQVGPGIGFLKTHESGVFPWGRENYNKRAKSKISLDLYYHFAGESKYSNIKPWYLNCGIGYMTDRELQNYSQYPDQIDKDIFFYSRIGRVINLSHNFGLNFDLGPFVLFSYNNYLHKFRYEKPIFISMNISAYIRL